MRMATRRLISPVEEALLGIDRPDVKTLILPTHLLRSEGEDGSLKIMKINGKIGPYSPLAGKMSLGDFHQLGFNNDIISIFTARDRGSFVYLLSTSDNPTRQILMGHTGVSMSSAGVIFEFLHTHFEGALWDNQRGGHITQSVDVRATPLVGNVRSIAIKSKDDSAVVTFMLATENPERVIREVVALNWHGDPVTDTRSFHYLGDIPLRRE